MGFGISAELLLRNTDEVYTLTTTMPRHWGNRSGRSDFVLQYALGTVTEIFRETVRKASGPVRFLVIGATTGLVAFFIHHSMGKVFEVAPMLLTYFSIASMMFFWGRQLPSAPRMITDVPSGIGGALR